MKNYTFFKKGFTVLELLVVLFIMTILLAIVLTSFTRGNKNTKNKVSVSEVSLLQVALEEYRAQCRVYPSEFDGGSIRNAYPGAPECILKLGELLPDNFPWDSFQYASLRNGSSESGVCSAYHLSHQLFVPSRYLEEDDDWGGDGDWLPCEFPGDDVVQSGDVDGWYDLVYGVPRN